MKYKGTFNFNGKNIILYTHSINSNNAFFNFVHKLVPILKFNARYIQNYFNNKNNHSVILIQD
jgi:hypothetical protein